MVELTGKTLILYGIGKLVWCITVTKGISQKIQTKSLF